MHDTFRPIFDFNDFEREQFIGTVARMAAPGSTILDAGAGPCRHRRLFEHCVYRAQDFAKYQGSDLSYGELDYVCDIASIPEVDEAFDLILCTEVLEHIPRPDEAVKELVRLLKPGGMLVITAPLCSGIHMPPYHFFGGFTPFWYQHFLALNGLEILSIKPNGGFFRLYAQESRRFLSMMTPSSAFLRWMFLPLKVALALWFRFVLPVVCHFLDRLDHRRDFTVGYFVQARKPRAIAAN